MAVWIPLVSFPGSPFSSNFINSSPLNTIKLNLFKWAGMLPSCMREGQRTAGGVSSLLPPCEFRGLNSDLSGSMARAFTYIGTTPATFWIFPLFPLIDFTKSLSFQRTNSFKILVLFCLHVCLCTTFEPGACEEQKTLDFLELELAVAVHHHVGRGSRV